MARRSKTTTTSTPTKNPFGVIGNARQGQASGNTPAVGKPARTVSMSAAGKIRARSVGVSSSSRQRTHKRGPSNRKSK